MFNNHTIKTQLQAFKNKHGSMIFKFMLQNCLISVGLFVVIFLSMGSKPSFWAVLEIFLAIPLLSVMVAFIRLVLKKVHQLVPYRGIVLLIIDIIVFAFALGAVGYPLSLLPAMPAVVELILAIGFDLLYIAAMLYLKKPDSSEE